MMQYIVTIEQKIIRTVLIDADTSAGAIEKVKSGDGKYHPTDQDSVKSCIDINKDEWWARLVT